MVETFAISVNETLLVLPRGGELFPQPITRLDNDCATKLAECKQRWPEENGDAVNLILGAQGQNPESTYWIGCETAFFADLPGATQSYALPTAERAYGYKRFGADGLLHAWVARRNPQFAKLISLHLCENTNLAAISCGKAVDTSAGYSMLEGLPGLTTCGDMDPSIVGLLNEVGHSTADIRRLLYKNSGWQALAKDITFAELCESTLPELALPRSMYLHTLIKSIGAMLSTLGGADCVCVGCANPAVCEMLFRKLETHFAFSQVKFQLYEVNREAVLRETFLLATNAL